MEIIPKDLLYVLTKKFVIEFSDEYSCQFYTVLRAKVITIELYERLSSTTILSDCVYEPLHFL